MISRARIDRRGLPDLLRRRPLRLRPLLIAKRVSFRGDPLLSISVCGSFGYNADCVQNIVNYNSGPLNVGHIVST